MNAYNAPLAWVLDSIEDIVEDSTSAHIYIKGHEINCTNGADLQVLLVLLHHSEIRREVTEIRDTLSDYLERTRNPSETTKV